MHTVHAYCMCTYVYVHVAQPLKVLHAVCVTYVCSMHIHTYMCNTLYREMLRVHLCVCVCVFGEVLVCVCVIFLRGGEETISPMPVVCT